MLEQWIFRIMLFTFCMCGSLCSVYGAYSIFDRARMSMRGEVYTAVSEDVIAAAFKTLSPYEGKGR